MTTKPEGKKSGMETRPCFRLKYCHIALKKDITLLLFFIKMHIYMYSIHAPKKPK